MARTGQPRLTHLDTHVVCWLYNGEVQRLSETARDALEAGKLAISPMVELEIQYLVEIGRFRDDPAQVLGALTNDLGLAVSEAPFPRIVSQARQLAWTRDAFDRLITAQAIYEDALLITKDRSIRSNYINAVW